MGEKKCKYCKIEYDDFYMFLLEYPYSGKKKNICDDCIVLQDYIFMEEPPDEEEKIKLKRETNGG